MLRNLQENLPSVCLFSIFGEGNDNAVNSFVCFCVLIPIQSHWAGNTQCHHRQSG